MLLILTRLWVPDDSKVLAKFEDDENDPVRTQTKSFKKNIYLFL